MTGGALRRDTGSEAERVALAAERIATLMSEGMSPVRAWRLIAREPEPFPAVERIARRIRRGDPVQHALRSENDPAWRALGAAWEIAFQCGAPVCPCLEAIAQGLREAAAARRSVQIARSAPVATARLVGCLPLGGLLLGAALGIDPIGVLLGTPHGIVCLCTGGALMLLGAVWSARLVRGAGSQGEQPGLAFDLVALGMGGGSPAGAVLSHVGRTARAFCLPDASTANAERTLRLAGQAGVPASGMLRREARAARTLAAAQARIRAERLSVTLLLPLGACTLPAFIALGVVPVVFSIMRSTLGPSG